MTAAYAPSPARVSFSPLRCGTTFLFLMLIVVRAFAGQVNLAWDASTDPAVTGYSVYYGQSSGSLTTKVDAGTNELRDRLRANTQRLAYAGGGHATFLPANA